MQRMKTFGVAVVAASLFSHSVEGFLPSQPFTSRAASYQTTSLYAAEDSLVVLKKGLKWILIPTAKPPPKPASSYLSSSPVPETFPEETTTPIAIVEAPMPAAVVEATPVTIEAPPTPVIEAAVSTPLPVSEVGTSPSLLDTFPSIPVPSVDTPVVEFLPKTAENSAALAGSETTMNFEQLLQAIRENHWASLPHIQESPTLPQAKAPMLVDILKDRGDEAGGYTQAMAERMQGSGQTFVQRMQESGGVFAEHVQESGEVFRNKISVLIDPELYVALKQKLVEAGGNGLSLEELAHYFKLDDAVLALPAMTEQLQRSLNVEQIQMATASWGDFTSSVAAVKDLVQQDGAVLSYDDIVSAMNLKETGGWYFGAVSLVLLLVLSVSNSGAGKSSSTIIMTDASMPEPVAPTNDSVVVEKNLQLADEQVSKLDVKELDLVDEQVSKLKAVTAEVYEQLREMKEEKYSRAYEVATMKSELRTVMNKLDANLQEEMHLKLSLERTQLKLEQETLYLRQQLSERVMAEQDLRKQLEAAKEKLAQEVVKVNEVKEQAEKKVAMAEKEVQKLEQEKSKMEQEMMVLRGEMEKLQRQLNTQNKKSNDDEDVPVLQPRTSRVVGNAAGATQTLAQPAKPALQQMTLKKRLPTTSYNDLSDAFFAAIAEPSAPQAAAVRGVKGPMPHFISYSEDGASRRVLSKRIVAKKLVREPDWSGMSSAALKKKTVKELATYLETKGSSVMGPDGKPLKKDDLVESVLSQ